MNPHPKVWVVRNEHGGFFGVGDSPRGWVPAGWTNTECVAVPVEEWARVQEKLSKAGAHNLLLSIQLEDCQERLRALDTTTPTTGQG